MQTTTQAKSLAPIPTPRAAPSRARRAFTPAPAPGPYRLPHEVQDRLAAALAPFRNREAAYALAVFLARYWSVPGRLAGAFPIDRRALADHAALGLTEKRVRNAIRTLEAVGFLDRAIPAAGSRYRVTEEGLHRKPVLFGFGADYAPLFLAANRRAAAARGRPSPERRSVQPSRARGPSTGVSAGFANGPESKGEAERKVLMGPSVSGSPPSSSGPNSPLEAALERLRSAVLNRERTASINQKAADWQGPSGAAPGRDS